MPSKRIALTKLRIKEVLRNQHRQHLINNINKYSLEKKWNATAFAQKLHAHKLRAGNSDFDRFRAMVLRRKVSKAVRDWVGDSQSSCKKI